MDNNNIDLGLTSEGSMSVDAILAEYEAENAAAVRAERPDEPAAEQTPPAAKPLEGPKYVRPVEDEEDYHSRRHSLSEVIERAKRDNPAAPPTREPGMSVEEIVFAAKLDAPHEEPAAEPVREASEELFPTFAEQQPDIQPIEPTGEDNQPHSRRSSPTRSLFRSLKKLATPLKPSETGEAYEPAPTYTSNPPEAAPVVPTFAANAGFDGDIAPTPDEITAEFRAENPTSSEFTAEYREGVPTSPNISYETSVAPPTEPEAPPVELTQIYTDHPDRSAEDDPFAALMSEGLPPERRAEAFEDEPAPETEATELSDSDDPAQYAKKELDTDEYFEDELRAAEDERTEPKPDMREKLLSPVLAIMSYSAAKREKRRAKASERRSAPKDETPELHPGKASMLYAQQAGALRLRCILATILTAVLAYISYGLPAAGLLGDSPTVKALVCLIMMLTVMLIGLDVFTAGFTSILRGRPGAEALIVASAFVATIDAVYIAITGNTELGVPFCGVSALSMTFALWGSKINCENYALSFYTAAKAEDPSVILSEAGIDDEGCALARTKREVTGFVRTAETADVFENAYRMFAPVMLAGCIILSLFVFIAGKECTSFIHTLGASVSICASLSAFFGMALPFSVAAKRLARSGVAIAGYSGCAELGRVRRVVITDSDLFPARTISVADISIAENVMPQKVISYTGSMIAAAGMCTTPVFLQLMRKNGCIMETVEDFACHEGGGVIARINGDQVYVGTASFMRLMGVRLPSSAAARTCIYTAINDSLAGFFTMNYTAVASVQRALVMLLSGAGEPVFAIRDFNITPLLLKQKFRLPSGIYDFPSFADRYRMSAPESEEGGVVSAMYTRGGLGAVAGLAKRGRRLYLGLKICCALSVFGSLLGMVLMLALCWTGAFSSASCGNIMTYMLLWLVPVLVISYGLRN